MCSLVEQRVLILHTANSKETGISEQENLACIPHFGYPWGTGVLYLSPLQLREDVWKFHVKQNAQHISHYPDTHGKLSSEGRVIKN